MPSPERPERPSDDDLVWSGIEEAIRFGVPIRAGVARIIASQLHGGQSSALYSLASTGHIDQEQVTAEISYELVHGDLANEQTVAAWCLGLYVLHHGDRPPVEGWSDLWG